MVMSADQEKVLVNKIDKVPEINIGLEVFVDFVIIFSLEEKVKCEKVVDKFYAL